MKLLTSRKLIGAAALVLLLGLSVSSPALGQGRGRRAGLGGFDRKCAKFVNCHDARDGRWDGRGPRRNARNTFWTRNRWSHSRRNHDHWNRDRWNRDRWNNHRGNNRRH
ncbi:MAG TPA: hypothetical protein VGJ37_13410 [Pyrinomonadaceae bacterium]|jgi:hypothetical protein